MQVRLLQINYEGNDKSRSEIKRDFFHLNMTCDEPILLRTTLIYTVVGQTLKLKSSTFYMYYSQIFTDHTTRNFWIERLSCVHIHKSLWSEDMCFPQQDGTWL